jgi:hypothetical protein
MKINSDLGYEPVTYSELTNDEEFWKGCQSCVNYEILMSKGRKNCMCTAMLFDPVEAEAKIKAAELAAQAMAIEHKPAEVVADHDLATHRREFKGNQKLFERWLRFKQFVLLKSFRKKESNNGEPSPKRRSLLGIFFW